MARVRVGGKRTLNLKSMFLSRVSIRTIMTLRGPLRRVPVINRLPSSLRLTVLLLFILGILTINIALNIARRELAPIAAEVYISNTVVIVFTTLTISYLRYVFPLSWDEWISESSLLLDETEKGKLSTTVQKAQSFGFGIIPITAAAVIYLLRLLIMIQTGQQMINPTGLPSMIHDFATIMLVLLSIWYLFFSNFVTAYIARLPLNTETPSDYKQYGKLNSKILILTSLFALNIGYYTGALVRWATVTRQFPWMLFFLGLIGSGVVLFFFIGYLGIRKGIMASRNVRLQNLKDFVKLVKSKYPDLMVEQPRKRIPNIEAINPSVILFIERIEREIVLHEQAGGGKVLNYDTLAKIVGSLASAILFSYFLLLISFIIGSSV